MRLTLTRTCIVWATFLFSLSASAQTGTLKGIIRDAKSNETIIGANVVLESDKGRGAASDFDGNFSIILPVGNQKVIISSIGYEPQTREVAIKAGETTTLNVSLEIESKQLEMVVVTAGKFEQKVEDLTVTVSVLKPDMVENRGTVSIEDAIEQTPGLTIMDSEPQMRGGSGYSFGAGARVSVLVDGLPISSGDAGRPSWGSIPVENLEQIEVIKGASSVLYGSSALNGIINIRTAYPRDKPQTKVNFYTGVYDAPASDTAKWWSKEFMPIYSGLNFFHSRKAGQWDIVVAGNMLIDNGFIGPETADTLVNGSPYVVEETIDSLDNVVGRTLRTPRNGFENRIRANFNLRRRGKKHSGLSYGVNGNVMYSRSTSTLLWNNTAEGLYRPYSGSMTRTLQTTMVIDPFISYLGPKGSKHSLKMRVYHQNNDNENNQANSNWVYYGEYQYAKRFAAVKDLTITAGIMSQYTEGVASLYAGGGSDGNNTALNAAGYLQVDKKFLDRINLNGGVRVEYFKVNELESEIKPVFRLGANTRLWKEGFLRASWGQGFRFPTIAERFIETSVGGIPITSNPDLKAENSWSAEVGLKQGIKIGKFLGYLDVAGFYQFYENFVEFNAGNFGSGGPFGGFAFKSLNTGDARVWGIDASLMGTGQFNDWFGINVLVGYTYCRPESLSPTQNYGVDNSGKGVNQLNSTSSLYGIFGDTVNYPIPSRQDTANFIRNPILKYRFEHLVNVDLELVFTVKKDYKVSIGGTYRYYSYMQSVDKIFYQIDPLFGWGARDFRKANSSGTHVFDLRVAANVHKNIKVGAIITNLTNLTYALRPLKIDPPRAFQLQFTFDF